MNSSTTWFSNTAPTPATDAGPATSFPYPESSTTQAVWTQNLVLTDANGHLATLTDLPGAASTNQWSSPSPSAPSSGLPPSTVLAIVSAAAGFVIILLLVTVACMCCMIRKGNDRNAASSPWSSRYTQYYIPESPMPEDLAQPRPLKLSDKQHDFESNEDGVRKSQMHQLPADKARRPSSGGWSVLGSVAGVQRTLTTRKKLQELRRTKKNRRSGRAPDASDAGA